MSSYCKNLAFWLGIDQAICRIVLYLQPSFKKKIMRKTHTLLTAIFILCCSISKAQTVILPANTITISNDTTITLAPGGGFDKNYHICPWADVIFTGISTYQMRFYLENNATVEIDDTFNFYVVADVSMKENSSFDFNNKAGSFLDTVIADFPCNLIDTGTFITNLIPATNLVFDYSLLPGGINPCGSPSRVIDVDFNRKVLIQNPVYENILINTTALKGDAQLVIYSSTGQVVLKYKLKKVHEVIPANSMTQGLYSYVVYSGKEIVQRGKLLKL